MFTGKFGDDHSEMGYGGHSIPSRFSREPRKVWTSIVWWFGQYETKEMCFLQDARCKMSIYVKKL